MKAPDRGAPVSLSRSASRRLLRAMKRLLRVEGRGRPLLVAASVWILTSLTIIATVLLVVTLLITYTFLFPFDLAIRAVKQGISE